MGSRHFAQLGEEDRALHGSWSDILQLFVLVTVVALTTWAATAVMRRIVHHATEALFHTFAHGQLSWAPLGLLGVLGVAALARGLLTRWPGWRAAAGDGMAEALDNFHCTYGDEVDDPSLRYDRPDLGLALRKGVTTVLTLGSGASGGLEAPMVLVGECLSAGVARLGRVKSEYALRTAQIAGISAAVTTLLGAPFTAALFAAEIAYGDRIIYRKLAYALWAGVLAYGFNNHLFGYEPLFAAPQHDPVYSLTEYGAAALTAVAVSGPVALLFGRTALATSTFTDRIPMTWRAPVTALAAGAIAILAWELADLSPVHILGMGEHTISAILLGEPEVGLWWVLLLALLGKMLATVLTLQGGGSAGLLVPGMVFGGVSGALTAQLVAAAGGPVLDPALLTVVGIASALVALIGVPLAAIALVLEVFGKAFGPPAILAVGLTYLVTLRFKLYAQARPAPGEE